jgi:arylformamidase
MRSLRHECAGAVLVNDWALLSRAERDAAYNNSVAVADSAQLIAGLEAASAKLRAEARCIRDVPYGPRERNRFDLFPAKDPAAPCLVFIHGGYWQRNTRDMFSAVAQGVLAHGWSAALPGYTLAPEATLAEIVAEIIAGPSPPGSRSAACSSSRRSARPTSTKNCG